MTDDVRLELVGDPRAPVVVFSFPATGSIMAISDREFARVLRALVDQASRSHPGSRLAGILIPPGDN